MANLISKTKLKLQIIQESSNSQKDKVLTFFIFIRSEQYQSAEPFHIAEPIKEIVNWFVGFYELRGQYFQNLTKHVRFQSIFENIGKNFSAHTLQFDEILVLIFF